MFFRLLTAEFKAMLYRLPKILLGSMLIIGAAALLTFAITDYTQNTDSGKSIIAVSASNDTFTNIALTAIENMESVSKVCKFIRVDNNKAEAMVLDNRASAALIFGDNFVEDIISGKNTQPRIIVSQNSSKLFVDLLHCGSSMLAMVQAGIYSAEAAYYEKTGESLSHSLNKELNMEYINTVFSREKAFESIKNTALSLGEYYIAMLTPVFLLLIGMSLGTIMFSEGKQVYEYSRLSFVQISVIQFLKALSLLLAIFIIIKLICIILGFRLSFNIMPVISAALIITCIYSASSDKISGALFLMIFTIVMGFAGGAFLPPALMPDILRSISEFMPINVMSAQLMGEYNIIYTLLMWLICIMIIMIGGRKRCFPS